VLLSNVSTDYWIWYKVFEISTQLPMRPGWCSGNIQTFHSGVLHPVAYVIRFAINTI
jgi:hypothetical protein